MASFATTMVLREDRTRRGTGRYCKAVRDAMVVVGDGMRMDMESVLRMEFGDFDLDRERSPRSKYPVSPPMPFGSAMVTSCAQCGRGKRKDCDTFAQADVTRTLMGRRILARYVQSSTSPPNARGRLDPVAPWRPVGAVQFFFEGRERPEGVRHGAILSGGRLMPQLWECTRKD
jgi:hypothetical protein